MSSSSPIRRLLAGHYTTNTKKAHTNRISGKNSATRYQRIKHQMAWVNIELLPIKSLQRLRKPRSQWSRSVKLSHKRCNRCSCKNLRRSTDRALIAAVPTEHKAFTVAVLGAHGTAILGAVACGLYVRITVDT